MGDRALQRACVLDGEALRRTIRRLAHEVVERHHTQTDAMVLAGVRSGGIAVALAVRDVVEEVHGMRLPVGIIDVSAYRDDRPRSAERADGAWTAGGGDGNGAPPAIDGARVIVVDDVIHTGRTLRAALDVLSDHGRPAAVELLVVIDRGRRELPLRPTYVGKNIPTGPGEWVDVEVDAAPGGGAWLVPA